jgi:hypothetical protein
MSQPAWRIRRQFGGVSYRLGPVVPINQLDSVVGFWQ